MRLLTLISPSANPSKRQPVLPSSPFCIILSNPCSLYLGNSLFSTSLSLLPRSTASTCRKTYHATHRPLWGEQKVVGKVNVSKLFLQTFSMRVCVCARDFFLCGVFPALPLPSTDQHKFPGRLPFKVYPCIALALFGRFLCRSIYLLMRSL